MKKLLSLFFVATLLICSSVQAAFHYPPPIGPKIFTTEDPGKPYEVISIVVSYQQFPSFGVKDPLVAAIQSGYTELEKDLEVANADAIIGLRIEFNSRPMKGEEGRVLLYGTLIKYK